LKPLYGPGLQQNENYLRTAFSQRGNVR